MTALSTFGNYIVYVDESGDHNLEKFDPNYPLFVLTFCIFEKNDYIHRVVPPLQFIKFKHFGHDMVVFHEHDIRKAAGPFQFLTDAVKRNEFMTDLNYWVEHSPFILIAMVIKKNEFSLKYPVSLTNPYLVALRFGLERVYSYLSKRAKTGSIHFVFEARGKKEDQELKQEFDLVCGGRNCMSETFDFQIVFPSKQINSSGLQLADLTARPIGRYVLNPSQKNRAFEIIERKLDRSDNGKIEGYGLNCYP